MARHGMVMDPIALLSYMLALVAVAYFALELVFTGARDRLYRAAKALLRR